VTSWRTRELAREAAAGLRSAPLRTGMLLGLALLVAAATTAAELGRADQVAEAEALRRQRGAYVVVVRGRDPDLPVPAPACAALATEPWVRAAGASRVAGPVQLTQRPGAGVQVVEVTAAVPAVWSGEPVRTTAAGWLVPAPLAATLGVVPGSLLAAAGLDPEPVAATFAPRRHPDAERWLVRVVPPAGAFDECWLDVHPPSLGGALDAIAVAFPGDRYQRSPLLRVERGVSVDPRHDFITRPERHLWLPAGAVLAVLWWLATWSRRSELALYRAVGTSRWAVIALLQIEVVPLALAMAIGIATGSAAHLVLGGEITWSAMAVAARTVAAGAAVVWLLAPVAGVLVTRRSIAALLKDR
jgi:hypothetical protein